VGKNKYKDLFTISHRKLCMLLLSITIACGAIFMCVKYMEYKVKFENFLLPGAYYNAKVTPAEEKREHEGKKPAETKPAETAAASATAPVINLTGPTTGRSPEGYAFEQSQIPRAST